MPPRGPLPIPPRGPRPKGCCGCGCLTFMISLLALPLGLFFGMASGKKSNRKK